MIRCWSTKIKIAGVILFLALNLVSCKKDTETLGAQFVSSRNGFQIVYDTTISLNAYTVQMDSVITSRLGSLAIGKINDPLLGISQASIITQFSLPGNGFSWGNNITKLDSCHLQLRFRTLINSSGTTFKDYYGNPDAIHTLKVYLLNEDLSRDSIYYSTRKFNKNAVEMGSWTGKFNFKDSTTIKLGTESIVIPPHIRIPMNQTFQALLYGGEARGDFASQTAFKTAFKGLVIVDETNYNAGEGAIAYIRLNSDVSAVTAYYGDSLAVDFPILGGVNGADASYNFYEQTQRPADLVQTAFKGMHRDTAYLQPLGGTKLRIEIPELFQTLNNSKIAINGANIQFTVMEGTSNETYSLPLNLALVNSDSLGKNAFLRDQIAETAAYYDGKLNNKSYSFNIVRHLQNLLIQYNNGSNLNYGMNLIIPADNPLTAERIILNTKKNSGNFKLKLTYTVIK
jgi:hypothetical protein